MDLKRTYFVYLLVGVLAIGQSERLHAQKWLNMLGAINEVVGAVSQQVKGDRSSLREAINGWEECKGGALSNSFGAVALYGYNGYYFTPDAPDGLKQTLKSINSDKMEIKDVTITENGNWLVLYDKRNCTYSGIPADLADKLDEISEDEMWSVSFNDAGDWVIITDRRISCSDVSINSFLKETTENKGDILSVSLSATGLVACCEKGIAIYGAVPTRVVNEAASSSFIPNFVKFDNCGNYLICSMNSSYKYRLKDAGSVNPSMVQFTYNYGNENKQNVQPVPSVPIFTNPSTVAYPAAGGGTQTAGRTCRGCNGTGHCSMCNGKGGYWNDAGYYVGKDIKTRTSCSSCNGTGQCKVCHGKGSI